MQYGLVLSGGGTRGAYHVGVLRAIKELGIEISAVSGTSVGAINGAVFVQGDFERLEEIWRSIRLCDVIKECKGTDETNLLSISNISEIIKQVRDSGFDISPFEELIKSVIDEEKIRNSPIDFGLVSVSLTNKKTIRIFKDEIKNGELYKYLIASASFPVFKKKEINEEMFIDGGVSDNMPISMLIDKGISNIIAVDVRGIGVKRAICGAGVNLIEIDCKTPRTGILDFDPKGISDSIDAGYYDCKKAFGIYSGENYYFNFAEYNLLKRRYGERLLSGMEQAAEIFGVKRLCEYSFEEFIKNTLAAYRKYLQEYEIDSAGAIHSSAAAAAVLQLIKTVREQKNGFIKNNLDIFGKYYNAAGALIYFERNF